MKQNITRKLEFFAREIRHLTRWGRVFALVLVMSYVVNLLIITTTSQIGALVTHMRLADFKVGQQAPRDLVVDKDVSYIDEAATELRKEATVQLVPPVFIVNDEITNRSLSRFSQFSTVLTSAIVKSDSPDKVFLEVQAALPGLFDLAQVKTMVAGTDLRDNLNEARSILEQMLRRGIVSESDAKQATGSDMVEILRAGSSQSATTVVPATSIIAQSELPTQVKSELASRGIAGRNAAAITQMVTSFSETNGFYDEGQTKANRQAAADKVTPVIRNLVKGERIIKAGAIVTAQDMLKVKALGEYSATVNLNSFFGTALLLLALYAVGFGLFSRPFADRVLIPKERFLVLGSATVYIIIAVVIVRIPGIPADPPVSVFFPTALVAMLVGILARQRAAISLSLLMSLVLLPVTHMDVYASLFAFLSGVAGAMVVSGAEKRIDLMRASALLMVANAASMVLLGILKNDQFPVVLAQVGWGVLNGLVCGILNVGLLPFLEHLLNTSTPFRLIELSDLNSPILKRMLTLAPGTHSHSVAVANLAESACREIGANPLLARVGAYYHDIGKIDQAEYFVENQKGGNKHDELKPSLSAAVIKSHVKIGIEKGKELGLPQEVINIIGQHHGSGLISYFYSRAVKSTQNEAVSTQDYSYAGTPPVSKEAAVVMLADGVEAISRTLKKPTVAKLEKLVWKSIMDKFASQQMKNCELTFRDLEIIKQSFVHILSGNLHSRIEYPETGEQVSETRDAAGSEEAD